MAEGEQRSPVDNVPELCRACGSTIAGVTTSEGFARARYTCGSAYLVFDDPRQGPACVRNCDRKSPAPEDDLSDEEIRSLLDGISFP